MEVKQMIVEERSNNHENLNSEEQIWFPNVLHYLQNNGVGDGKHGLLQRARPIIIKDFLSEADLADLLTYTLEHETEFQPSQIFQGKSDKTTTSIVRSNTRRSLILPEIQQSYKEMLKSYIDAVLPGILQALEMDSSSYSFADLEYQLTASNDKGFFKLHTDSNAAIGRARNRALTYVYYFYQDPKAFSGGDLHIYETIIVEHQRIATLTVETIHPIQNQIVFFPSNLLHEVTQIECPSQQFADSRFTFNGWLHRPFEENV